MNFPFLDGAVPRSTSYGVYISQLIRFARVSSHVDDFNSCPSSWLSLMMSLMASFLCCPFFPRNVLDEIWDSIESVSEGFPTYLCLD